MKTKVIILNKHKKEQARCNRNEYFSKYAIFDNDGAFKRMAEGSPLVICIDGSYYYVSELAKIAIKGASIIENFITDCREPILFGTPLRFIWR